MVAPRRLHVKVGYANFHRGCDMQSNDPVRQVVAALIVNNNIYMGVNEIPEVTILNPVWKNREAIRVIATHAEVNAVRAALQDGVTDFKNAVLFVTLHPCDSCMQMIRALGIETVYYNEDYVPSKSGVKYDTARRVNVSKVSK